MDKKYFILYLNPLRPDFAQTMTDDERNIMQQHVAYWADYLNKGMVIAYGPVMDPKEIYGVGIVAVDDESQLKTLIENAPAGKINKYEYYPMRVVLPKKA